MPKNNQPLVIVGTGFVGGVTGAVLADLGVEVRCVDINEERIKTFEKGYVPYYEADLESLVRKGIASSMLTFTTSLKKALVGARHVMITVDTPDSGDGSSDLSKVFTVAKQVMQFRDDDQRMALIVKSTAPATCVTELCEQLKQWKGQFEIVSNPEFLREGSAVQDTLQPDRIIVGCRDEQIRTEVLALYAGLDPRIQRIEFETPEEPMLVKHGANALLAAKISFINNLAQVCEQIPGADIVKIADGIGSDCRIGRQFLDASIGYGGACFPKDVKALAYTASSLGASSTIFDAIAKMNEEQLEHAAQMISEGMPQGSRIAVFGLAFKKGTSDTRTSPAVAIIDKLKERNFSIVATDPVALRYDASENVTGVELEDNVWKAATGADCAAFLTEWDEYRKIDLEKLGNVMRFPVLFDGRCLFDPQDVRVAGLKYRGIGRGPLLH